MTSPWAPAAEHAQGVATADGGDDLVFPGRHDGRPIAHTTLRDAIGRAHRLSPLLCELADRPGFGPKRVQALMGHSSIAMTFDIYGHLFPQEDDAERFAAGEQALVGGAGRTMND